MGILASDFDQTRYLKAEDVPVPKKFRIKSVAPEELGGLGKEKETKLVVNFTNDKRGLVLNKTNNRVLRGEFGDAVDGWVGKIIVVFSEMKNNGKRGLSVQIAPPKQATAAPVAPQPQPSGNSGVAAVPPQPSSGNGAAAPQPAAATTPPTQAVPVNDPELEPDPEKSLSGEMDDELPF
jgi:hypothetical protein